MFRSLLILSALLSVSPLAAAQESVPLMECPVSIEIPGQETLNMNFRVVTANNTLTGWVDTIAPNGAVISMPSKVEFGTEDVRENVLAYDLAELNFTEKLIYHAMSLESTPSLSAHLSSGVELEKVRSARIFVFGDKTEMGSSTVVQAMGSNGEDLGSFLGGFLLAPCR